MKKTGFIALAMMVSLFSIVLPEPVKADQDYSEGFEQARRQAAAGDYLTSEQTLRQLDRSNPDNPEIQAALGRIRLWQKDYPGAIRLFRQSLTGNNDPAIRQELVRTEQSQLEHLVQMGETKEARTLFASLPPLEQAGILSERPDLPYLLVRNNLKVEGGLFAYSGNRPNELDMTVALTQHISRFTGVLSGSRVRRFGLTDTQAGLELHAPLGANRSGFVSATFSPDASFLPRYTAGGEFYQGWRGVEGSIGYSRLGFSDNPVNIVIPGITFTLSGTVSLNERLYLVVDSGAITALTTLKWEPDHRFRSAYAIGVGNAAEHITSNVDTTRYFTLSNRISAEYRVTPEFSCGGELSHEYRQGLYTQAGATLLGRYWW